MIIYRAMHFDGTQMTQTSADLRRFFLFVMLNVSEASLT